MAKRKTGRWEQWGHSGYTADCLPGFLKDGRRFHVYEGITLHGIFDGGKRRVTHHATLEELNPIYGRRPKGEGRKPRPRLRWESRRWSREFKTSDQAREFADTLP